MQLWGTQVSNYGCSVIVNEETIWEWKPLEDIGLSQIEIEEFSKNLNQRPVSYKNRQDKLIWVVSKDDIYRI